MIHIDAATWKRTYNGSWKGLLRVSSRGLLSSPSAVKSEKIVAHMTTGTNYERLPLFNTMPSVQRTRSLVILIRLKDRNGRLHLWEDTQANQSDLRTPDRYVVGPGTYSYASIRAFSQAESLVTYDSQVLLLFGFTWLHFACHSGKTGMWALPFSVGTIAMVFYSVCYVTMVIFKEYCCNNDDLRNDSVVHVSSALPGVALLTPLAIACMQAWHPRFLTLPELLRIGHFLLKPSANHKPCDLRCRKEGK